jgi:hypothetical protein
VPSSYIQFYPLAYLVKLNIEMTIANVIKPIATSTSKRGGSGHMAAEFATSTNKSSTGHQTSKRRSSFIKLSSGGGFVANGHVRAPSHGYIHAPDRQHQASERFPAPVGNQVRKTEEIFIRSEPIRDEEREVFDDDKKEGLVVWSRELGAQVNMRSRDDITEGGSVKDGASVEGGPKAG